jgi:hypothetical protein
MRKIEDDVAAAKPEAALEGLLNILTRRSYWRLLRMSAVIE